ncbi:phage major capsid protein [Pseudomonas sp. SP16.1]|uniref:phage major capsid protein n=1 Tax=Pseudomonas sp. SP16.1 TaxID=3458854 RepID=UPI0040455975
MHNNARHLIQALQELARANGHRENAKAAATSGAVLSILKQIGTGTGNISGDLGLAYREILQLAQRRSLISKIDAASPFRKLPSELPALEQSAGSIIGFIGEGQAIPVGELDFTARKLPRRKLSGIVPVTREMASAMPAESALSRDLIRAVADGESAAFFSNAAAAPEAPAGILAGVTPGTGSNNPANDIAALIDAFTGDLDGAVILTSPRNGVKLAPLYDGTGARGGELAGVGHVTHAEIPDGEIAIIEPGRIMLADDGLEIDYSNQATIATLDSNGDPAVDVSLWQHNLSAYRLTRWLNWHAAAGSVAWLNSVNW